MISRKGRVAIGTIQSVREDISHELLATLLFGAGFDIFNLGGNVSPELSINNIKIISPDILVLSGLDEDSVETISESITSFKKSGIKIPMIVGPRIGMSYIFTIDSELRNIIPADDFINDLTGVSDLARNLVKDGT
jgi:5-methyltetrahydrofolate--homocysteine methyltransferase